MSFISKIQVGVNPAMMTYMAADMSMQFHKDAKEAGTSKSMDALYADFMESYPPKFRKMYTFVRNEDSELIQLDPIVSV